MTLKRKDQNNEVCLSSSSRSVFIQCCPLAEMAESTHPFCNGSHFVSPLISIQGLLLLQTNLLLLHLLLSGFLRSSSLSLATHFKIQRNTQNTIVIPPQHMSLPSNPFAVANKSIVFFNPNISICSSVVFLSTTF